MRPRPSPKSGGPAGHGGIIREESTVAFRERSAAHRLTTIASPRKNPDRFRGELWPGASPLWP